MLKSIQTKDDTTVWEKFGSPVHSKQSLRLWLRLLTCTNIVESNLRNKMSNEFGTTLPRFDVLSALDRNRKGLTMGELSEKLMVSNGNVTGVVGRLIDDGLVTRDADPRDRRSFFVKLTPSGKRKFSKMAKVHESWIDDMFSGLSEDEIATLLSLLEKTRNSFER